MSTVISKTLLAAALLQALVLASPAQAADGAEQQLAQQVKAQVLHNAAFQGHGTDVQVAVQGSTVTLTGWVEYASDDALARQIAATVPGVQTVYSQFHTWSTDQR